MFKRRTLPDFLQVPWGLKDLGLFVVVWIGLQVVLLRLLVSLGPVWPSVAGWVNSALSGQDVLGSFALDLLNAVVGLGVVALIAQRYNATWEQLGWRRVNVWRTLKYLAAILIIFVVAANLLLQLVSLLDPNFNADQAQTNEFTGAVNGSQRSLALIALVLLPPMLEETIFRGFLFPAIAKKAGVIWGAIISSAIFGLAHAQANISIYTFVLGLLLCFMYVRLKSIVPGIFLHMLNNYLAFLALSQK